jgi:uncharacterized protein YdeI (YjbR/CyaY-like superfamily)
MSEAAYFATPAAFRAWLKEHHATARELLVGFYKVGSGTPSMTWKESVDEALSFGWIDGVRKRIDDERYTIRFTPRQARSIWSDVNLRRAQELIDLGRMEPAGLAAFERRDGRRTKRYSFENPPQSLPADDEEKFRANAAAWAWFAAQPPSLRRVSIWYVVSAKQEATRRRRLAALIDCSERGERLPQLTVSSSSRGRSSR